MCAFVQNSSIISGKSNIMPVSKKSAKLQKAGRWHACAMLLRKAPGGKILPIPVRSLIFFFTSWRLIFKLPTRFWRFGNFDLILGGFISQRWLKNRCCKNHNSSMIFVSPIDLRTPLRVEIHSGIRIKSSNLTARGGSNAIEICKNASGLGNTLYLLLATISSLST